MNEELHRPFVSVDSSFGVLIEVGAELSKSGQFAVLSEVQTERTGNALP